MRIQVVKSTGTIHRASRINTNSSYGFTTAVPDMTDKPANVFVQPAQDDSYEPDITVMNVVSAYPPEIVSKYGPIDLSKIVSKYRPTGSHNSQSCLVCNPLNCKQCRLPVRRDMLNVNGYCIYCREGINKSYPRIS